MSKSVLGEEDPESVNCLDLLAWLYDSKGDDDRAEPLYRHLLEVQQQTLGAMDPVTTRTMQYLADLYAAAGEEAQADALRLRTRKSTASRKEGMVVRVDKAVMKTKVLEAPPLPVTPLNWAGWPGWPAGDYARAEPLWRQVGELCSTELTARRVRTTPRV